MKTLCTKWCQATQDQQMWSNVLRAQSKCNSRHSNNISGTTKLGKCVVSQVGFNPESSRYWTVRFSHFRLSKDRILCFLQFPLVLNSRWFGISVLFWLVCECNLEPMRSKLTFSVALIVSTGKFVSHLLICSVDSLQFLPTHAIHRFFFYSSRLELLWKSVSKDKLILFVIRYRCSLSHNFLQERFRFLHFGVFIWFQLLMENL
jgi:hypothetical protein